MDDLLSLTEKIKSATGVLYILCGYPYAGKSCIARQIVKETGAISVSIDDIFHERGFDWDTNKLPNEKEWADIFNESYIRAAGALRAGDNVLYDSTNQTVASRDMLREVARSVGTDARVIFVISDEATVWKRWRENARQHGRHTVAKELVAHTIATFEPPTEDEKPFVVHN